MKNKRKELSRMRSVRRVSGVDCFGLAPVEFVFFICPRMKSGGFWLNREGTGLEAKYVSGVSIGTAARTEKVRGFAAEAGEFGIGEFSITAIFSDADALILFPGSVPPAPVPSEREIGFPVRGNCEAVRQNLPLWDGLYRSYEEWVRSTPQDAVMRERKRLRGLVAGFPEPLVEDFVIRVFAGFALDGILLRRGALGQRNPVILGVESPGVPALQNARLAPEARIPVVELS